MFFTEVAIKNAFPLLVNLDVQDGKPGKSRKEKVSGLRHLLAASRILKGKQGAGATLDLSVGGGTDREAFIKAVGEIVSIDDETRYTVDFANEFANKADFAVGSNFLTTIVANSRGERLVPYPKRPAPLLDITSEKMSIRANVKDVLEAKYNLGGIRAPLAIWLLRSIDIPGAAPTGCPELQSAMAIAINLKFEPLVAAAITPTQAEWEAFLSASSIPVRELFGDVKISRASLMSLPIASGAGLSASNISSIVDDTFQDFIDANLRLRKDTIHRFLASLLTKRFVIVTGLSGSGKTRISQAFAEWIAESEDQFRLVAVGADWTNNENILGYQDALQDTIYRKPSNGTLELILRAKNDPDRPYFLILDEMNLSHVERYFADLLSAIESGQKIALHSASGEIDGVPAHLNFPDNLFIVGTVNVDETTYLFSPKVLDRANVIEFRAAPSDIGAFLEEPLPVRLEEIRAQGASFGRDFVSAARTKETRLVNLPERITDGVDLTSELKARLVELFTDLSEIGAEFGFRTAYEISRFVYFHALLHGPGWQFKEALDAQVLQKLLPKLHGSERRLRPVLDKLSVFCARHGCDTSQEKIARMLDRLKDGFTSFAEA